MAGLRALVWMVGCAAMACARPQSAVAARDGQGPDRPEASAAPAPSAPVSAATPTAAPSVSGPPAGASIEPRLGLRCGIGPGDAVVAPAPWPGESARCRALDRKWAGVERGERACKADADCAVVVGTCESWAVARRAASKYREPPCEQPTPRTCSRPATRAACEGGCCVVAR
jgi:hypothetical protein